MVAMQLKYIIALFYNKSQTQQILINMLDILLFKRYFGVLVVKTPAYYNDPKDHRYRYILYNQRRASQKKRDPKSDIYITSKQTLQYISSFQAQKHKKIVFLSLMVHCSGFSKQKKKTQPRVVRYTYVRHPPGY